MAQHRILLVDDDATMLGALGDLLGDLGHDVVTATQGSDALRCLAEDGVDLIVLDVAMPTMDAFQFREQQRSMGVGMDVPVLVLSGSRDVGRSASRLHADRWMEKPADLDELVTNVNELLRTGPDRPQAPVAGGTFWLRRNRLPGS